jgi:hypothetical protein
MLLFSGTYFDGPLEDGIYVTQLGECPIRSRGKLFKGDERWYIIDDTFKDAVVLLEE